MTGHVCLVAHVGSEVPTRVFAAATGRTFLEAAPGPAIQGCC